MCCSDQLNPPHEADVHARRTIQAHKCSGTSRVSWPTRCSITSDLMAAVVYHQPLRNRSASDQRDRKSSRFISGDLPHFGFLGVRGQTLPDAACAPRLKARRVVGGRIISQRFETFRRAARTLRMAAKPKYSILNKASHIDRLSDQIKGLREKAKGLPAGDERDALLRKAEQDEIALRLIEWITSSGQLPPPEDLIPIRRHRLRRE
jgi:hypothetical protein